MATAKEGENTSLKLPPGFSKSPPSESKGFIDSLKKGKGRVVFTSSRGEQQSWIKDENSSIYTYHLLEALQGAGNTPGDTEVRVSNLMHYLGKAVPESAKLLCSAEQTPWFNMGTEDFAIAKIRGGKGLQKIPRETGEVEVTQVIASGGRAIAIREMISGDNINIVSGDNNIITNVIDKSKAAQSYSDVQQSWHNWRRDTYGLLLSDLRSPSTTTNSPLQKYWKQFIRERGWHNKLKDCVSEFCEGVRITNQNHRSILKGISYVPKSFIQKLENIEYHLNYETILSENSLKEVIEEIRLQIKSLEKQIKADIKRGKYTKEKEKSFESFFYSASRDLKRLYKIKAHISSQFNKCFLVTGSSGSGKTHFYASLLSSIKSVDKSNLFLLSLKASRGKTVEAIVLEAIKNITGSQWDNLEAFHDFLKYGHKSENPTNDQAKLIIVIDNLQSWVHFDELNIIEDLTSFIYRNTYLHNISWLITARDSSYDRIISNNDPSFWSKYSYFETVSKNNQEAAQDRKREGVSYINSLHEETYNIGGWVVLDDLNERDKTGIDMIKHSIGIGEDFININFKKAHQRGLLRKLSNPFIARLVIEFSDQYDKLRIRDLISLNFIDFVELFGNKRLSTLKMNSLRPLLSFDKSEVEDCINTSIDFIADFLLSASEDTPKRTKLTNYIQKRSKDLCELQNREITKAAIQELQEANLIKTVEGCIYISSDFFWEYQIAKRIEQSRIAGDLDFVPLQSQLENLIELHLVKEHRESIVEFLLLLVERSNPYQQDLDVPAKNIWALVLSSEKLSSSSAWFAGSKVNGKTAEMLIDITLSSPNGSTIEKSSRGIFSFMHFSANAQIDVSTKASCIGILQPYYEMIKMYSLSSYFYYVVERLVSDSSVHLYLSDLMLNLSGCEVLGITEELSSLTLIALKRNYSNIDNVLQVIFEYLQKSSAQNNRKNRKKSLRINKEGQWERYSYREWILHDLCQYIVRTQGASKALRFLTKNFWYKPQHMRINKFVGMEMQREANMSVGRGFRTLNERERASFIEQVCDFADADDSKSREIAKYIVKHSSSYTYEKDVLSDQAFRPVLEKLLNKRNP